MLITNNITGEVTEVEDIISEPIIPTPEQIQQQIKSQLDELDAVLPRCVEDVLKLINENQALPQIMQDRIAEKEALRQQLRDLG